MNDECGVVVIHTTLITVQLIFFFLGLEETWRLLICLSKRGFEDNGGFFVLGFSMRYDHRMWLWDPGVSVTLDSVEMMYAAPNLKGMPPYRGNKARKFT